MRTEAVRGTAKFGPIPTDSSLPASPPAEVLAALDTARGVLDSLGREGFDLRLRIDSGPDGKSAVGVLTEPGGSARELSPLRLARLLAGDGAAGIVVDETR